MQVSFIFTQRNLPKGVNVVHKLPYGNVDLQFSGMGKRLNNLRIQFSQYAEPDMRFARAGKSGSVRLRVPKLNTALDFGKQAEDARAGLDAAKRLLALYIKTEKGKSLILANQEGVETGTQLA